MAAALKSAATMAALRSAATMGALRSAGRNIGVLRHQVSSTPAVAEERRRFVAGGGSAFRRFSTSSAADETKHYSPSEKYVDIKKADLDAHIAEVAAKKEDLFYQLAHLDKNFKLPKRYAQENRDIIYKLFRQVKANPDDPIWSQIRINKNVNDGMIIAVPICLVLWTAANLKFFFG